MQNRLNAKAVKAARHSMRTKGHERIPDGGGLYLQVTPTGGKSWVFRYSLDSRQHFLGLGAWGESDGVTLAEARALAALARSDLEHGRDPAATRTAAKEVAKASDKRACEETLEQVAKAWIKAYERTWKHAKSSAQVTGSLTKHVYPIIGSVPISQIETSHIRQVLDPIWHSVPVTAERVRGRLEAILSFAKVNGMRQGDNPATWRGHLALSMASGKKPAGLVGHHAALQWAEMPDFMIELRTQKGTAARALEFLILTASRTSETILAVWDEIDLDKKLWTIPAERMKASREHRVPLSAPALAILKEQLPLCAGPTSPVFQSGARGTGAAPLSNMAILALLRRINPAHPETGAFKWADARTKGSITAHGFRSSFRDWCADATTYPASLAELALAHVNKDRVESAYLRGDGIARRVDMMNDWAKFVITKT